MKKKRLLWLVPVLWAPVVWLASSLIGTVLVDMFAACAARLYPDFPAIAAFWPLPLAFVFFSVLRCFYVEDVLTARWQEGRPDFFRAPDFLSVTGIGMLLFFLLPGELGKSGLSFWSLSDNRFLSGALLSLLYCAFSLVAYRSARAAWRKKRPENPFRSAITLVSMLLATLVTYNAGFALLLWMAGYLIAAFFILAEMRLLFIIILLILSLLAFRLLRTLRVRRKFLKDLYRLVEEKGFDLSPVARPYRSLFRFRTGANFTVTAHGKVYTCKFMSCMRRNTHLIFTPDGNAAAVHNYRFRRITLFSTSSTYASAFEGEGVRLFIVNPVPLQVYVQQGGILLPLDTGGVIGKYRFFTASGFLGGLERDCLDRIG